MGDHRFGESRGELCETKPIPLQRPQKAGTDRIRKVAAAGPDSAKQSQFPQNEG